MARDTISILDGSTFVISDARGDIDAAPDKPHGLFHRDTRFLSRWRVTVNGATPDSLSVENEQYHSAQSSSSRRPGPSTGTHEIRFGELVHFGERPHAPYFGASDTTPLFTTSTTPTTSMRGHDRLLRGCCPHPPTRDAARDERRVTRRLVQRKSRI
jgi:hypothetical protein